MEVYLLRLFVSGSAFIIYLIYLFRESKYKWEEGQRERGKQAPNTGLGPGPRDHDLSQRQTHNRLSHQGTLSFKFIENYNYSSFNIMF